MLIFAGRESTIEAFLGNSLFKDCFKTEKVLFTSKPNVYTWYGDRGDKFFTSSLSGVQNKTFGLGFMEQVVLTNETVLAKLGNVVNYGIIFNYMVPWSITSFFDTLNRVKDSLVKESKIKKQRDVLEEKYKQDLIAYREEKKRVKEVNKETEEGYKAALKAAPEEVKAYITEPKYLLDPIRPEEPKYPEFEKGYSIHSERLNQNSTWRLLSKFEFIKIDGTDFGLLRKRPEQLVFNTDNVLSLDLNQISVEEFQNFIKDSDIDTKKTKEIRQVFIDVDSIEVVSDTDKSIFEIKFSEENALEEVILPCLAPIKPMHAASMLAGGIGSYSKELILKGHKTLLKAAIVKEFRQRKTIIDGKEIEEVVEMWDQKMGIYDMATRHLAILG